MRVSFIGATLALPLDGRFVNDLLYVSKRDSVACQSFFSPFIRTTLTAIAMAAITSGKTPIVAPTGTHWAASA
jgi:hypothetical protein